MRGIAGAEMANGRRRTGARGRGQGRAQGRNREELVNIEMAAILDRERGWTATPERTDVVRGQARRRPDIVVDVDGRAVIIETEFPPASGLEGDVARAAEYNLQGRGRPIATLGVVLPQDTTRCDRGEIAGHLLACNSIRFCIVYGDGTRFPSRGYLAGSLLDVRTAVQLASVPVASVRAGYEAMAEGVGRVEHLIREMAGGRARDYICRVLRQGPGDGTWRMAALVILNAGMFYDDLSGHRDDVPSTQSMSFRGIVDHAALLNAWRGLRAIDYAPIFDSAIGILEAIPPAAATEIIEAMLNASSRVMGTKANRFVDFYGMLYQRLLYERKRVAAFYTRPEAAALLAGLTIHGCGSELWADPDRIRSLRIADFACGSGTLLHAAYSHVIQCTPLDMSELHSHMMENCIWAADIFPVATHFAVSSLSSLFPGSTFDDCHIYTRSIGPADGGGYHLGSLDLVGQLEPFVNAGVMHGGRGARPVRAATLHHDSCDYILMNPPFVRATNHGGNRPDPVPPFALPGIPPETQIRMGGHNSRLFRGTCAHGHAGLASHFLAICDKKIKKGTGRFGLILPDTFTTGPSWSSARRMLAEWYDDMTVAIVLHGDEETYSADTLMHEIVLVAQKRDAVRSSGDPAPRIKFVILDRLPSSRIEAVSAANAIRDTEAVRLEDDVGTTSVVVGDGVPAGIAVSCPADPSMPWICRRVEDVEMLQFAYRLMHGRIRTGGMARGGAPGDAEDAASIPIAMLGSIAAMGRHHLDIIGTKKDGTPQGPFNKVARSDKLKYRCLWNNDAGAQQAMAVEHDCSLEAKHDATREHVKKTWATSGRLHLNNQVRYGAQRLIAAYTDVPVLGGRSWPNANLSDKSREKALALWCNSTFGLLLYWVVAGSQHRGRGMMGVKAFSESFPVLDVGSLDAAQIDYLSYVFDIIRNERLEPLNAARRDPVRKGIDEVLLGVLGIDLDMRPIYRWISSDRQFHANDSNVR